MQKENNEKRIGPVTSTNRESVAVFIKFMSTFYQFTLKFSETLHVTSNNFYYEICETHTQLAELTDQDHTLLSTMTVSKMIKYNKYWKNVDIFLDPGYKMKYLRYCF